MSETGPQNALWPAVIHAYQITLPGAERNLALDEALLNAVESDPAAACLRFWQPEQYAVVLGRSNDVAKEVIASACVAEGIPILRRSTGGGAVVIGPGCLCYSLVLPLTETYRAFGISRITTQLMARTASGLHGLVPGVEVNGTSDLSQGGLKFSGNSQRWLRRSFIHHGTLLFNFDLDIVSRLLAHPSREPAYRHSRSHGEFVINVDCDPGQLKQRVACAWNAVSAECPQAILNDATRIAAARAASADWTITRGP